MHAVISRPSTRGTRKPAPSSGDGTVLGPVGEGGDRHRGVPDASEIVGAAGAARSRGAAAKAGTVTTTRRRATPSVPSPRDDPVPAVAVGLDRVTAVPSGPRPPAPPRLRPAGRPAARARPRRRGTPVRRAPGPGPRSATVDGQARRRRRRPRMRLRDPAAASASWGAVAARLRSSARPALMPPTSGSTRRSTTSGPSGPRPPRRPTGRRSAPAGSGAAPGRGRPGHRRRRRARPTRSSGPQRRSGTPSTWPSGSGPQPAPGPDERLARRRRDQVVARGRARGTGLGAQGTRARNVSGPASTGTPPSAAVWILPPSRSPASSTVTAAPGPAQEPGGGQAGDPAADHDHTAAEGGRRQPAAARARTTSARVAQKAGSSFGDGVRAKARPQAVGRGRASMSRS